KTRSSVSAASRRSCLIFARRSSPRLNASADTQATNGALGAPLCVPRAISGCAKICRSVLFAIACARGTGYGGADFRERAMSEQRTTATGGMETAFGFRRVNEGEKQDLVNNVFHRVADRYDLMNDLMSGGLHRAWKAAMVDWLSPSKRAGFKSLDVDGGTGDIAFRIVEASNHNAHVTVLDINGSMLGVGRDRAIKRGIDQNLTFVEANAEALPFEDNTFD